jgi:hypothetical protein
MFGRTTRIVLLLIATQLSSGCFCCCHRPIFWRKYQMNGCCEPPCTTCCGSPGMAGGPAMPAGMPVYTGAPVVVPTAPVMPGGNPASDRMPTISSTAISHVR